MRKLRIIGTGTGRCGTTFLAEYLTSAGIPCGHERFFCHGGLEAAEHALEVWPGLVADSSWLAAPFLNSEPLKEAFVIHLVRHPKAYIESSLRTWGPGHTPWTLFAQRHLPGLERFEDDRITWLAYRYAGWNRLIRCQGWNRRHYMIFNIEREPDDLLDLLILRGLVDEGNIDRSRLFNDRRANHGLNKGEVIDVQFGDIASYEVQGQVYAEAARYDYNWN